MTTTLTMLEQALDDLRELLRPASTYAQSCRAERVASDLDVIQSLPLDLALAGFKVSVHVPEPHSWRIQIEKRFGSLQFQAMGRGEDYVSAFDSLLRASRKSMEKLGARLLAEAEEQAA